MLWVGCTQSVKDGEQCTCGRAFIASDRDDFSLMSSLCACGSQWSSHCFPPEWLHTNRRARRRHHSKLLRDQVPHIINFRLSAKKTVLSCVRRVYSHSCNKVQAKLFILKMDMMYFISAKKRQLMHLILGF